MKYILPLGLLLFTAFCWAQNNSVPKNTSTNSNVSLFTSNKITFSTDFSKKHFSSGNSKFSNPCFYYSRNALDVNTSKWLYRSSNSHQHTIINIQKTPSICLVDPAQPWNYNAWGNPTQAWNKQAAWGEFGAGLLREIITNK